MDKCNEPASKGDVDDIKKQLETVIKLLTGNGNPEKGIIVRLDRVEQWRGQINWGFVLVGGFMILGALKFTWDLLIGAQRIVAP